MPDVATALTVSPMANLATYMVEVYRPAGDPAALLAPAVDGHTILELIEVPGDEMALVFVAAADAAAAERLVLAGGLRPIRVVDVRWQDDHRPGGT
jgi:hypothetical protein